MSQHMSTTALATLLLLAGNAINSVSAQLSLPDASVPNQGGQVWNVNDPQLVNYTFKWNPPFITDYGGHYQWAANNNTVAIKNVTAVVAPLGLKSLGSGDKVNTKYPYYSVFEGTPKQINTSAATATNVIKYKKIVHVMFENEVYSWTMNDTWWKLLATRGRLFTRSYGVTHPSYSNYVAIVAGDYFGIEQQDWINVNTTTIYDLLDIKGISYATYAEQYTPVATSRGPNDCNNELYLGPLDNTDPRWNNPVYRRVDVPCLLFSTYTSSYTRCSKLFNASAQWDQDVFSGNLPQYVFYAPDMLHNGHDPEPDSDYNHQPTTAGEWFNAWLDMYLPALTAQGAVVIASWDEATWQNDNDAIPDNQNHIATLIFGAGVTPNTTDDSYHTHYGTLRGSITNWGLASLGRNDTNTTNGNLYDMIK